jgi:PEGA domain
MSPPRDPDEPPFDPEGPQLGSDGKLTSPVVRRPSQAPEPELQSGRFEKLELVEREEKLPYVEPGPYRTEPKRSRRLPWAVAIVFAVLGMGVGVALWKVPTLQRQLPLLPLGHRPTVFIQSDPSGATVRLAGSVVGVTPYAADNLYSGDVPWSLSLAGHRAASGKLKGGVEQRLNVTLKPVP